MLIPEAEFLASSDNWFRPVQFANAPDGTLYVIDMYRQLIEGAAFLAPQILKHMDTSAGSNQGRIYRIAPDGFQSKPIPRLGDLPTVELVKLFEHPNGWHRDTASRLIYERQDSSAIAPLKELASSSTSALARVMAQYSLQGLSALEPSLVVAGLKSDDPRARQHALKLAESFADKPDVVEAVVAAANDDEITVRYQAAFSLGAFTSPAATEMLSRLALRDGTDPWMQLAILSSIGDRRGRILRPATAEPTNPSPVANPKSTGSHRRPDRGGQLQSGVSPVPERVELTIRVTRRSFTGGRTCAKCCEQAFVVR